MSDRIAPLQFIALFVVILFALVLLSPITVIVDTVTEEQGAGAPVTSTFTSTAHFDAGTKAPTASGNLGIETSTDNLGIAAGAFELGNLEGDSFTTADADADTAKWNLIASVGTETVTRSIAGGILNIDVETLPGGTVAGVITSVSISGNWDVRTKADLVVLTGANDGARLNMLNENDEAFCGGLTVDGIFYDARKGTGAGTWRTLAFTCSNGIQTFIGTESDNLLDPIWLRMTKSGTAVTWYYSSDGSAWTLDETLGAFATSAANFWTITSLDIADDAVATQIDFDDFHVLTGTVDAGGYRTIGNWTSVSQASSGVQAEIVLTYSGASAQGYIDFVALYDGSIRFAFDDTNVIGGGPTVAYVFVVTVPTGWTVRVGLGGDGSATTTIEQVEVGVSAAGAAQLSGTNALLAQAVPVFYAIAIVLIAIVVIKWVRWDEG